jgi:hypothetical protein
VTDVIEALRFEDEVGDSQVAVPLEDGLHVEVAIAEELTVVVQTSQDPANQSLPCATEAFTHHLADVLAHTVTITVIETLDIVLDLYQGTPFALLGHGALYLLSIHVLKNQ